MHGDGCKGFFAVNCRALEMRGGVNKLRGMKKWMIACVGGLLLADPAFAQNAGPQGALVRQLNDSFADVYERVAPAVVVIEVQPGENTPAVSGLPQGLEFFLMGPDGRRVRPSAEQGSGFIISPDGFIMTNNHVVQSGEGGEITVKLKDGRKFPARLVGADERSDIAVLKIEAKDLPVAAMGDSDKSRVGQFAFAIGAPFDLPYTFTVGVISAMGRTNLTGSRTYEEYIQTDASINPGNSGGPLCDIDGNVIGVNTLISGLNRGLGFAVPINIAKEAGRQLIESGRVVRPWLGIGIVGLSEANYPANLFPGLEGGVLVRSIEPQSPAFGSELQAGDVITKVDGVPVIQAHDLQKEILAKSIGQAVKLEVWRRGGSEGRLKEISVRTGEQPQALIQASNRVVVPIPVPQQPIDPRLLLQQSPPNNSLPPSSPQGGESLYGMVVEDEPNGGVKVLEVQEGSPAALADFKPGDIIREAWGRHVQSTKDFKALMKSVDPSRGVMVIVERNGETTFGILKP